jgi:hypothetical protein
MAKKVRKVRKVRKGKGLDGLIKEATDKSKQVLSQIKKKRLGEPQYNLPVITKGGKEVKLNRSQKRELEMKIKIFGENSIQVKALMMQYASEARVDMRPQPVKTDTPIPTTRSVGIKMEQITDAELAGPSTKRKRRTSGEARIKDAITCIIDFITLTDKKEKVVRLKYKAAEKMKYEKAANLRSTELEYDKQIQATITKMRNIKRML